MRWFMAATEQGLMRERSLRGTLSAIRASAAGCSPCTARRRQVGVREVWIRIVVPRAARGAAKVFAVTNSSAPRVNG
jgi:hypothetical protein